MAGTYLLPTLSHTPLSATLLPMIPRSALILSAGSVRICTGLGGSREKNSAFWGVRTKKDSERDCEHSPRFCRFIPTTLHALCFSPHPPTPLAIPQYPVDGLSSQPFALLPPQSILCAGCPTVDFSLSLSARHIPLPSEPTIAGYPAYQHPPDALCYNPLLSG